MNIRNFLSLLAVIFLPFSAVARERLADDHIFKPFIGKRVTVQGLAWGEFSKGLGERVVIPSGIPIYFTGKRYSKLHRNGRLVRVVGRLSVRTMEPAPPGAQGYTSSFEYYALEVDSMDVIDQVEHEFPQLIKK